MSRSHRTAAAGATLRREPRNMHVMSLARPQQRAVGTEFDRLIVIRRADRVCWERSYRAVDCDNVFPWIGP
jgi:hypothetical protein